MRNLINSNNSITVLIIIFYLLTLTYCKENKSLPDPLQAGWNGHSVCEQIENNEHVRILKCTFAPGVGHEKHYHDRHFGYTLSGSKFRITDKDGTREVNVPTGSDFFNEKIEWHEVLNIGDDTAVFLIMEPK